jgi:hypothetical protein
MHNVEPRRWAPRLLLASLIVVPLAAANLNGRHVNVGASVMVSMFAATLATHPSDSLRTGGGAGRPFTADRAQEPGWFWAHVVLHFVLATMCLLSLLLIWGE